MLSYVNKPKQNQTIRQNKQTYFNQVDFTELHQVPGIRCPARHESTVNIPPRVGFSQMTRSGTTHGDEEVTMKGNSCEEGHCKM